MKQHTNQWSKKPHIQATHAIFVPLLALVCAIGLRPTSFVQAANQEAPPAQIIQATEEDAGSTQPIDVVVLLDDSGSMATCWPWPQGAVPFTPPCRAPSYNPPSDPDELRYSAARLLVQLADPIDRVAVVRFDTVAEGIGALGALQQVGDLATRQSLAASLVPPTDYYPRGYTRLDLGLAQVTELLAAAREPGRSQYVLILTDGEPTTPAGQGSQRDRIYEQIDALRSAGVLVFPVVLCNPSAGCAGEFLREYFAAFGINEAGTPQDLLRVFSQIFTEMKPDRSLITDRNGDNILELTTRAAHGVRSMSFVTPHNGLVDVQRNSEPMLTRSALDDANIHVNVLDANNLTEGNWTATISDGSGFAVVQADSYPQLLNPPPSVANSPASVRYYPAGKPPLLIAKAVGPGSGEELFFNGETLMTPFGQNSTRALLPSDEPTSVRLQLGDDSAPLQLIRSFRLEPRNDLPPIQIFSPLPDNPGLLDDGRAQLQIGFGGADVQHLTASLFVYEKSSDSTTADAIDEARPLVYQATMQCGDRLCTDQDFTPVDGHSYQIYFVLQGEIDGIRFGDWTEASLTLSPAVYVRGLPNQLDLGQMPPEGWPIELASGTLEDIGMLSAVLELRDSETGEPVSGVNLNFMEDVPEEGTNQAVFAIEGLGDLRPGEYTGEVTLQALSPAGLPMDVQIRPGSVLPVNLAISRPVARVASPTLDFGEVLFDTSPNFRLNQSAFLPIDFGAAPFKLTATLKETTCQGLSVSSGAIEVRDGQNGLPLQLSSSGPLQPTTCTGMIQINGPDADHDVIAPQVDWQIRVADVEWSIVSSDLHLPDLQDAGARVEETILLRFNGKTPFVVQMADLQAIASNSADIAVTDAAAGTTTAADDIDGSALTAFDLDMPPVEVTGPPNESGLYEVPITFIARQAIPRDPIRGNFYSGNMALQIAGLEDNAQRVNFNFRSPSIVQRYVAPFVVPVYSMPWLLCTGPLSALLLLVMVARIRGRGFDEQDLENAAAAATAQITFSTADGNASLPPLPARPTPGVQSAEGGWASTEWGNVWSHGSSAPSDLAGSDSGHHAESNTVQSGDPWQTSW